MSITLSFWNNDRLGLMDMCVVASAAHPIYLLAQGRGFDLFSSARLLTFHGPVLRGLPSLHPRK